MDRNDKSTITHNSFNTDKNQLSNEALIQSDCATEIQFSKTAIQSTVKSRHKPKSTMLAYLFLTLLVIAAGAVYLITARLFIYNHIDGKIVKWYAYMIYILYLACSGLFFFTGLLHTCLRLKQWSFSDHNSKQRSGDGASRALVLVVAFVAIVALLTTLLFWYIARQEDAKTDWYLIFPLFIYPAVGLFWIFIKRQPTKKSNTSPPEFNSLQYTRTLTILFLAVFVISIISMHLYCLGLCDYLSTLRPGSFLGFFGIPIE
ncbi:hypothetical protein NEHOM01_1563 [Nematocida homosporus]|uniref:uncharacterized protein n=1 Tax=Nematocida homosporus TaxID=1912981 RepID=UPI0022202C8C|nr:uncharacterized protein NEHOM01_1563 [Nematocida homosporus]KAI5186577.1 hypothetical protein NEHOM01_1563 [Nematocida homosporus]